MKINQLYFCLFLSFLITEAFSQDSSVHFNGFIKFEKKMNVHAIIDSLIAQAPQAKAELEPGKKKSDKFYTEEFTLSFDSSRTFYQQAEKSKLPLMMLKKTSVFSSLGSRILFSEKVIPGNDIVVKDSMPNILWRLTNESREICGLECRRADGLLWDSVYIVAFFAEAIPISGGPESFNGLPGLILEVHIPNEHTSWTAYEISYDKNLNDTEIKEFQNLKVISKDKYLELIKPYVNNPLSKFLSRQLLL
ncbi:MAG TPA: GLPGLI family protein [Niabella sp.]|nr:GLPGLI family protein [Niabella sp.]